MLPKFLDGVRFAFDCFVCAFPQVLDLVFVVDIDAELLQVFCCFRVGLGAIDQVIEGLAGFLRCLGVDEVSSYVGCFLLRCSFGSFIRGCAEDMSVACLSVTLDELFWSGSVPVRSTSGQTCHVAFTKWCPCLTALFLQMLLTIAISIDR